VALPRLAFAAGGSSGRAGTRRRPLGSCRGWLLALLPARADASLWPRAIPPEAGNSIRSDSPKARLYSPAWPWVSLGAERLAPERLSRRFCWCPPSPGRRKTRTPLKKLGTVGTGPGMLFSSLFSANQGLSGFPRFPLVFNRWHQTGKGPLAWGVITGRGVPRLARGRGEPLPGPARPCCCSVIFLQLAGDLPRPPGGALLIGLPAVNGFEPAEPGQAEPGARSGIRGARRGGRW
jgi:hypothetical protein